MIEFSVQSLPDIYSNAVNRPLPEDVAENILLNYSCHVDHEGFDLNEIEQEYYKHNGISLVHDKTWYKDGAGDKGSNSIILPWIRIDSTTDENIIIDHSHFVLRYPLSGLAAQQVRNYATQRPELLRILSVNYKFGLDLCIDYINTEAGRVEPIVHIEWDYDHVQSLHAVNLKIIGRAGVGVDNIDIPSATEKGVIVVNSPEGNTVSAAEHTIALLMALMRKIAPADASVKQKKWERSKFVGNELNSRTLGIIGLGKIGQRVGKVALALGMKVLGYDPYVSKEKAEDLGFTKMELLAKDKEAVINYVIVKAMKYTAEFKKDKCKK